MLTQGDIRGVPVPCVVILHWVDQGAESHTAVDYIVAPLTDQNLSLVKDHVADASQDGRHGETSEQAAYALVVDPGQLRSARQAKAQNLALLGIRELTKYG